MGEHMVVCTLTFLCNTTFPLETYCEGQVYMRVQRARRRGRCTRPLCWRAVHKWTEATVHKLPLKELRKYHLSHNHKPSKMKKPVDLATTLKTHRAAEDKRFRNTWLLTPLGKSWVAFQHQWSDMTMWVHIISCRQKHNSKNKNTTIKIESQ